MRIINRNSMLDAKQCIDSFLAALGDKDAILKCLSDKIEYANQIDSENWNLNLDQKGKFLQFNVGQVYCVQIDHSELLVLCLKDSLPEAVKIGDNDLNFLGYDKTRTRIISPNIADVPDCLVKVPDSIGVLITERFDKWLPLLDSSNSHFLRLGIINTKIKPQMIGAHSIGAIDHLSAVAEKDMPNPDFALEAMKNNEDIISKKIKKLSNEQLNQLITLTETTPPVITTRSSVYGRNPYIAELAKRKAKGNCQDCGQPAPFINKNNNEPYLEVHHIHPLSEGGKDSIENTIALCPNCHRKRHHG